MNEQRPFFASNQKIGFTLPASSTLNIACWRCAMTSPSIGMESLRRGGDGKDAASNPRRPDPGITTFCPGMTMIGKSNVILLLFVVELCFNQHFVGGSGATTKRHKGIALQVPTVCSNTLCWGTEKWVRVRLLGHCMSEASESRSHRPILRTIYRSSRGIGRK